MIVEQLERKKELLKGCSQWLYQTKYSLNPAENSKETSKVEEANNSRDDGNVWFLPGYFNTISKGKTGDGTPKIKRQITVPKNRDIFCMVASDHASRFEVGNPSSGIENKLRERVKEIHQWNEVRLTIDGVVQELDDVETDVFDVTIAETDPVKGDHPYVQYYKHLNPPPAAGEKTPMITKAKVALIDEKRRKELGLDDGKEHVIDFYALSDGDAELGEIAYEIDVRYKLRIGPDKK